MPIDDGELEQLKKKLDWENLPNRVTCHQDTSREVKKINKKIKEKILIAI